MSKHRLLTFGLLAILALVAGQASAQVTYVIEISVDGLGGTYLNKIFNGTATGGPYLVPNFARLKNEGASTLAAHIDNNNWETLPNHTSILTGRPQTGVNGHGWIGNSDPSNDPANSQYSIQNNKGSYVASVFDVAHDNGLSTGLYATKTKFSLFDHSYGPTTGAIDVTGPDNGRDKIDGFLANSYDPNSMMTAYLGAMNASPLNYSFVHFNAPDTTGHASGWGSAAWNQSVVGVDTMLGSIFKLVEQDVPAMKGHTAIILTADHGNQDNPPAGVDRYSVPFFVWGPGVTAGADLYALNAGIRQPAASYPMTTYSGMQPIRNAEGSNLALELLGLGPIPGSTFDYAQDLVVPEPVTLSLLALGGLALLRRRR
jgi:predicted AlkP superfamily pyrophosphatase or phosphodiesterase